MISDPPSKVNRVAYDRVGLCTSFGSFWPWQTFEIQMERPALIPLLMHLPTLLTINGPQKIYIHIYIFICICIVALYWPHTL